MISTILLALILGGLLQPALSLPSGNEIIARQVGQSAADPNGLPAGWISMGCYSDTNPAGRSLQEASFTDPAMTPLLCTQLCSKTNGSPLYTFAGTEYSSECYCDYNIQGSAQKLLDTACTFPCAGDANQTCGGAAKISIYRNTQDGLLPTAGNKPIVSGGWAYLGCFSDALNGNPRTLDVRLDVPSGVTAESCTTRCGAAGFTTAGLEFAQECWCGNDFDQSTLSNANSCSMTCKADHTELCGAGNFLSVYKLTVPLPTTVTPTTVLPSSTKPVSTPGSTSTSPSTSATPTISIPNGTTVSTTVTAPGPTATVPISIPTSILTLVPTTIIPIPTSTRLPLGL